MSNVDEHTIDEIVENMASKLYFHGHPINRQEAKNDLKLKVNADLQPELESAIWSLYKEFAQEFQNSDIFNAMGEVAAGLPESTSSSVGHPLIAQREVTLLHAMITSARMESRNTTRRRYTLFRLVQAAQQAFWEDVTANEWTHVLFESETVEGQKP